MRFDNFERRAFSKPEDTGGTPEKALKVKHLFRLPQETINKLPEQVRPIAQYMADGLDGRAYYLMDLMSEVLENIEELEDMTTEIRRWVDALNDLMRGEYDLAIGILTEEQAEADESEDFVHRMRGRGPDRNVQFEETEMPEADQVAAFIATLRALSNEN